MSLAVNRCARVRKTESFPFFQALILIASLPNARLINPTGKTRTKKTMVKIILETTVPKAVLKANQNLAKGLKTGG